jgi:lipopolysaccharide transport system ATP-binding protein
MSDIAIQVERLGKKYRIGSRQPGYRTLRETITDAVKSPAKIVGRKRRRRGADSPEKPEIWALKEVSFDVRYGEALGIIGANGAGKSTLLKILSRITRPTEGRADVYGRVGSLLEVGTGFHPELTGRENIYLNGTILGMSRTEVDRKFDEIIDFAGIEEFIDTPVKHYSSGMYVRLAFAVAANVEPEILLVDEVLSVGDAEFQKKCLGKMNDVAKEGRTVLFISHNLQAISTLTSRCLVLDHGQITFEGNSEQAIVRYSRLNEIPELRYLAEASATEPKITQVYLKTSNPNNVQRHGQPMEVHIEVATPLPLQNAAVSFRIWDHLQKPATYQWCFDSQQPLCRTPGIYHLTCIIPKTRLYLGQYTLSVNLSERFGKGYPQKLAGICPFEVVMHGQEHDFTWSPGACMYIEDSEWDVRKSVETLAD